MFTKFLEGYALQQGTIECSFGHIRILVRIKDHIYQLFKIKIGLGYFSFFVHLSAEVCALMSAVIVM